MKTSDDACSTCDSISSSVCGSLGSISSIMPGSVTTVLSSALASTLTFSAEQYDMQRRDVPVAVSDKNHHEDEMKLGKPDSCQPNVKCAMSTVNPKSLAVDFAWLRDRCEGDETLVLEVLRTFFAQGQCHLKAMQRSMEEMDHMKLMFHSVVMDLILRRPLDILMRGLTNSFGTELPRRVGFQCWGLVPRKALPGRIQGSQSGNRAESGLLH
jgi:hypothetical protein